MDKIIDKMFEVSFRIFSFIVIVGLIRNMFYGNWIQKVFFVLFGIGAWYIYRQNFRK